MTTKTVNAILIRILPNPTIDAGLFQGYLKDLTITAYDQQLLSVPQGTTAPGTAEYELGSASTVTTALWTPLAQGQLIPPFVTTLSPGAGADDVPVLGNTIFQHLTWGPADGLMLKSVATAVILVNPNRPAPPALNPQNTPPSPYAEYPATTSYDIRLSVTRGSPPILLPQAPIEWNITTVPITYETTPFLPFFDVDLFTGRSPLNASIYLLLHSPPPTSSASSTINLATDGTPPKFNDLVQAVNPVLSTYGLTGASSLATLTVPLTSSQCDNIAYEIMYNPALQQIPVPVPPYPSPPAGVNVIEDLYTTPGTDGDNYRKQFEGNLQSYHANNDSAAKKLSPFIFAVSAAIYAETQTINASLASFTLPLFESNGTSATSATITLSASDPANPSNATLSPPFVVPAAFFYALSAEYPATSDADHRYQAILTTTTDSIYKKLQTALAKGILNPTESPVTLTGAAATAVNDISAVLRLAALSANYVPGSDPTFYLTGSLANLVTGWLAYPPPTLTSPSPFWVMGTPPEFDSQDYLNVVLQVVTQGPYPSPFITAILATPLVPVPPANSGTYRLIGEASDLTLVTNSSWLALFQSLFNKSPRVLPTFVEPGTVQQQTQAFITWITTLFTVGFQPPSVKSGPGGNVSALDFSSDVLASFFSQYAVKYSAFTFASSLVDNNISDILQSPDFSDPTLQKFITNALNTIRTLYVVTAITTPSAIDPTLQFSYMEALYARGFTTLESIAILQSDQFATALTGTVAYSAASTIYGLATTPPVSTPPTQPEPGNGFQPCNPGDLVNCIPPPNLSPFGRVQYLYELLQLSSGTVQLGTSVSQRRGAIGSTLTAALANLNTEIPVIDLVNESLEMLGSNLAVTQGAIYNTAETSLAGFKLGEGRGKFPADKILASIAEHSSPAIPTVQPAVYNALKVCFTSPGLPYSQTLDICRSYLCHIGTNRFDTMRHFRQAITEFPLALTQEPADFEKEQWRLPVRFDIALEYLQISMDEYTTLWTAPITAELLAGLYGADPETQLGWYVDIEKLSYFLASTCLTYCDFICLWKSGVVKFSRGENEFDETDFPDCPPCCLSSFTINFGRDTPGIPLAEIIIFIRLWQKLQLRCQKSITMNILADICPVLQLFSITGTTSLALNPDFIRQLASLLMLVDLFQLPWTGGDVSSGATGVDRTKLLGIWAGPTAQPTAWAIKALLIGVEKFALRSFECQRRGPEFAKILSDNLDKLSRLAGFTTANPWFTTPTCTIRFAEVLAKIYASNFTVGEIIFLFTVEEHYDGDDPYPLDSHAESIDHPLNVPDDQPQHLSALRQKLLCVDIGEDDVKGWNWPRVESAIRAAGLVVPPTKGSPDPLLFLAQHFFPAELERNGYQVGAAKRRFTTSLSHNSTSPSMWSSPPCDPFHFSSDSGSNSDSEESGQLWIQLPLCDGDVLKKLRALRQLNPAEIRAAQNLYFAPRLALAPFIQIFSSFGAAVRFLVAEPSEKARFEFFKREVVLFHRRCEIIAGHLAEHVASVVSFDNEQTSCSDGDAAWSILKSLVADENTASTPWEDDSGQPPTQFSDDPKFSGSAFAALLGLVGTGLEGQYEVHSQLKWLEMRGGVRAFGSADDEWNTPVLTILPALDVTAPATQDAVIAFKNGLMLNDDDGKELGGAQPFEVTWTGSLIVDQAGCYRFGAGSPTVEKNMPGTDCCAENCWLVTLGRGQKTWFLLNRDLEGAPAPAHLSSSVLLHTGVYVLTIKFVHKEQQALQSDALHREKTGFQLKYDGPDTGDCPTEVPLCRLMRDSKTGPFKIDKDGGGNAYQYLQSQYISTFRDVRRTYQRAFKALLFAYRFDLSARKTYCDHQSELGYILDNGGKFQGTSYYVPQGGSSFQSHHAYLNFNFLPVKDPYMPPSPGTDSRAGPSVQRQAAMFDWFERIFDYTRLRRNVEIVRKRPVWLLFQDVASQKPSSLDQYVRHLGIDIALASLALTYFATPAVYQVANSDLLDERWPVRLWHVREWICEVSKCFYSDLFQKALPYLWASDDPSVDISSTSGIKNLTYFVQHSSLSSKNSLPSFKAVRNLNNGLRSRARQALLAYLCGFSRVSLTFAGTGIYATKPGDLSDLLLQDVQADISEKSSRIDDAILSVQTFVQRAQIGLETSFPLTHDFSKSWQDRFLTFDVWVAWKRRDVYKENWLQWEELEKLYNFEGPKFLKEELRKLTATIVEPGRPVWWVGGKFPSESVIEPIQIKELTTYEVQQGSTSTGLSLIGTPQKDARPSLLAAGLVFPSSTASTTTSSTSMAAGSSSLKSKALTAKPVKAVPHIADATGLGTLAPLPLWIEAAVRIGTQFIRVAAAGVPPAFRYSSGDTKAYSSCCSECGLLHEDVVDEYYFWLQNSNYYDYNDAQQLADTGSTSAVDPTTDWENNGIDAGSLPTLLHWPSKPLVYLSWTRVHMGRLDPPRRSSEGIRYDSTTATPYLSFTGRTVESLNFTAFTPSSTYTPGSGTNSNAVAISLTNSGFRYDILDDATVVVPQAVPDVLPTSGPPLPLAAFPGFVYFQPGKPLLPVSSFGVSLAMASSLRTNCRFEAALRWCQLAFDPLSRDNTWPQCPPKNDNNNDLEGHKVKKGQNATTALGLPSSAAVTKNKPAGGSGGKVESAKPPVIKPPPPNPPPAKPSVTDPPVVEGKVDPGALTPTTTPSANSPVGLESREINVRDLPCCPSIAITHPVARSRAALLEFLKILLHWGDRLLHYNSMEDAHHALMIFNTMDRILGPIPALVNAHDKGGAVTIDNFAASPPPLNPELLKLYDIVTDRKAMVREAENNLRLRGGLNRIRHSSKLAEYALDTFRDESGCAVANCFSYCQPYRFTSLLPKAMDLVAVVKELGSSLLSAYEKGDSEYLAAIRQAQDRKILDLGLTTAQNQWRASDWDVQALDESMINALTRLHYYQNLISGGLNSGESGYQFATENAMQSQNASNVAEGTAQAANIIPDLAFGVAGMGPYESTTIPIGQKLANAASSAARIMQMIALISSGNAGLQLTQAGWVRRAQDWQNQVNVISTEIQMIKRQTLAAWRRRATALHELNNHQQQQEHAAEVQDFMRDKFTKQELYLFLQQETAALYRQAYTLAVQIARDAQDAFKFERGDIERDFLNDLEWDNLHEGLMAGDRLDMSLRLMDRAYMETNCREYEITKHLSAKLQFPEAFLKLKSCGYCEIDIPEWMFDLDYPGHYFRRIKTINLRIASVAGPYTSINCRLRLLNSAIRVKPLLSAKEECCCGDKSGADCCSNGSDPYVARQYGITEAIATSDGQDDNGLFNLDFKDERFLPFEFKGAVSRWRVELPPENNQWDIASLTDVVINLNYTAREGGLQLRKRANECAQRHLPGDGIRFFDIRHEFVDTWRIFQMENSPDKRRDWPLRFCRSMFPFIVGRRAVRIRCLHLFIEADRACLGQHLSVRLLSSAQKKDGCKEEVFVCTVGDDCPSTYHGKVAVNFGPIAGNTWHSFGHLTFGHDMPVVREAYLLCEYEVDCLDNDCRCKKCCAPDLGSGPWAEARSERGH